MPKRTLPDPKQEAADLERTLAQIDADIARLRQERLETRAKLEKVRTKTLACPKCGRDRDFLTDGGGFLVHVLEDPEDTENLQPGKPLFCPNCGEVFLRPALDGRKASKSPGGV